MFMMVQPSLLDRKCVRVDVIVIRVYWCMVQVSW